MRLRALRRYATSVQYLKLDAHSYVPTTFGSCSYHVTRLRGRMGFRKDGNLTFFAHFGGDVSVWIRWDSARTHIRLAQGYLVEALDSLSLRIGHPIQLFLYRVEPPRRLDHCPSRAIGSANLDFAVSDTPERNPKPTRHRGDYPCCCGCDFSRWSPCRRKPILRDLDGHDQHVHLGHRTNSGTQIWLGRWWIEAVGRPMRAGSTITHGLKLDL